MENTSKETIETEAKKEYHNVHEKHATMAAVAYLLFFVPLITDAKDDVFVKFHVKQGFVLFLTAVLVNILSMTPLLIFAFFFQFGLVILVLVGMFNALTGKKEELPFIGQFADRFTF